MTYTSARRKGLQLMRMQKGAVRWWGRLGGGESLWMETQSRGCPLVNWSFQVNLQILRDGCPHPSEGF